MQAGGEPGPAAAGRGGVSTGERWRRARFRPGRGPKHLFWRLSAATRARPVARSGAVELQVGSRRTGFWYGLL